MRLALVTCFNADWRYGRVPAPYVPLNLPRPRGDGSRGWARARDRRSDARAAAGRGTDGPGFHRDIAELILGHAPEVIGLTTMCNSYPPDTRTST